jgi:hypothetical protein
MTEFTHKMTLSLSAKELVGVVAWLRRLVVGLAPRRPWFAPGSVHVGFVVDKVTLDRIFTEFLCIPYQYHHSS